MKVNRLRATTAHKRLVAEERSDHHRQVSPLVPLFYRELSLNQRIYTIYKLNMFTPLQLITLF